MPNQQTNFKAFLNGRRQAMYTARTSWFRHWAELARLFLPRRYRWLVTTNDSGRGSPINDRILDSAGVLAARNCASGLMSGKVSPITPWFALSIDGQDATGTTAVSLWLFACQRIMYTVFARSNFYTSTAQWLYDLVIFGTSPLLIYDDHDTVINCVVPCAGEYYVALDGKGRPTILYRDFTMTVGAIVEEFGIENCPAAICQAFKQNSGGSVEKEWVICHAIEPNTDGRDFGVAPRFTFREAFWVYGSSQGQQSGGQPEGFLRIGGFTEQPHATVRWDISGNDPYGRSPAMDALPDQRQLMQQTKRKAQGIDKQVNPPLVADAQLQGKATSLLPGGVTYIQGMMTAPRPGMESIYKSTFSVAEISKDLDEVRERLKYIFYNHLFQPISQFETRSNVTAVEINQRKSESLIMLGPVFERLDNEGLAPIVERVWGICARNHMFPPAPPEIAGRDITANFVSMLALAQSAANSAAIGQVLSTAGNLAAIQPDIMDKINTDIALDIYSRLLNNDPRMMRTDEEVAQMRAQKAAQQQQAQQADNAQKLAAAAGNLANAKTGQGSALDSMMGQ